MFLCVKGEGNKTLYSYLLDFKDRNSRQIQKKSRIVVIKDEQVGTGLNQILKNYIFLLLLSNLYEWELGLPQYGTSHLASFKLLHQPMLPPLDSYDENFSCGSNLRTTWGKYFLPSLWHTGRGIHYLSSVKPAFHFEFESWASDTELQGKMRNSQHQQCTQQESSSGEAVIKWWPCPQQRPKLHQQSHHALVPLGFTS